jgi:hypothetical protein
MRKGTPSAGPCWSKDRSLRGELIAVSSVSARDAHLYDDLLELAAAELVVAGCDSAQRRVGVAQPPIGPAPPTTRKDEHSLVAPLIRARKLAHEVDVRDRSGGGSPRIFDAQTTACPHPLTIQHSPTIAPS